MGTETEYGISVPEQPGTNAMLASSLVVNAYASRVAGTPRPRWDFEEESPLRDARGFDVSREPIVDPQAPSNEEDLGLANVILTQRRAAVRGPRPPGVLQPGDHLPAGRRPVGQGG